MLHSSILFSIQRPPVIPPNLPNKDIGIYRHGILPISKAETAYKKSSTSVNCLALSETHIFAVQADKAVVQVYDREKTNREIDVPFGEKIASCLFIEYQHGGGVGVLALGMEGGRLILWEICTGREISTLASHLEAVTCLATDSTRNFLLSGSKDHNVHVWSLPALLSFATDRREPWKTFSDHRGAITALAMGHSRLSNDIVVSASEDKTILLWNYRTCTRLATYLVSIIPKCLAMDPVDRAFYIGYENGVQYADISGKSFPSNDHAIELGAKNKTKDENNILSLTVSQDGAYLFTGHENGKVQSRHTPNGQPSLVYDAQLPVTNIVCLGTRGFPHQQEATQAPGLVKPKLDMVARDGDSMVPDRYEISLTFSSAIPAGHDEENAELMTEFDDLLTHPSFPLDLLEASRESSTVKGSSLDDAEHEELRKLKTANEEALVHIKTLENKLKQRDDQEERRQIAKKAKRIRQSKAIEAMRKKAMGEANGAMEVDYVDEDDASSETD